MESLGQRDVRQQGAVSLKTISGQSRDLLIIVQHFEFPGTRDAVVASRRIASRCTKGALKCTLRPADRLTPHKLIVSMIR